jgi:membrane-bound metal-dependent hydrolase YbcI (DUF457 family)
MDPVAHTSIALIAKRINNSISLITLIIGTQITDLLFLIFQFAGIEKGGKTTIDFTNGMKYNQTPVINFSHSVVSAIICTFLIFFIAQLIFKRIKVSLIICSMIISHRVLDFLVYWNLPVSFEDSKEVGLGLMKTGNGFIIGIGIEGLLVLTTVFVSIKLILNKNH